MNKTLSIVAFVCGWATTPTVHGQFRFIKAHSEAENRILGSNFLAFDSYRNHRMSTARMALLNEGDTTFNAQSYSYFVWNNPEHFGYRRTKTMNNKVILKTGDHFLTHPNRFWSYSDPEELDEFAMNPVLDLAYGPNDNGLNEYLLNGRGVEVIAQMGNQVALYSTVLDYQAINPSPIKEFMARRGTLPGVGLYSTNFAGYTDYFFATGYLDAKLLEKTKANGDLRYRINATLGYDQQHIGSGFRSLLLSNFAGPTAFLQVQYQIGPFKYQNLFKELVRDMSMDSSRTYNKKYMAMHRGTLEFEKLGLELGFSESIIQSRPDNGIDPSYLNPVIFYRSVERDLGSPDNILIALDANWKHKNVMLYGQFVLDEFHTSKIVAQPTHSYNKHGYQLGAYVQLPKTWASYGFVQLEYNQVRPFTYSHYSANHYTHRLQSLAHPLESNFKEWLFRGYWVPRVFPRWSVNALVTYARKGYNDGVNNLGGDILEGYRSAANLEDAPLLQGIKQTRWNTQFSVDYTLQPGATIGLQYRSFSSSGYRAKNPWALEESYQHLALTVRWNMGERREGMVF